MDTTRQIQKNTLHARYRAHRQELQDLRGAVQQWRPWLREGRYVLEGRFAYRNGPIESKIDVLRRFARGRHGEISPMASLHRRIRGLLGGRIRIGQETPPADAAVDAFSGFKGSILISRPGKTTIVDPETKRVMHSFGRPLPYTRHVQSDPLLREHLNAPRIHATDDARRWIIEDYIIGRPRTDWDAGLRSRAETFLAKSLIRYHVDRREDAGREDATVQVGELVDEIQQRDAQGIADRLRGRFRLDSARKQELPLTAGHGDLRLGNLVHDGGGFHTLDWEFSRTLPFVCDLLHWPLVEATHDRNMEPLERYLAGGMDDRLREAFEAAGVPYQERYRHAYLGVVLMEWLLVRMRAWRITPSKPHPFIRFYVRWLDRADVRGLLDRPSDPEH